MKLIKSTGNHYDLRANGELIASTYQWVSPDKWLQLSRQNCNSLFGIVDVEKLANEYVSNFKDYNGTSDVDFMVGFLKAMELNKDKVFTLEQVHKLLRLVHILPNFELEQFEDENNVLQIDTFISHHIQQPAEIDVEIVMETKQQLVNGYKNQPENVIGFVAEYENILAPKLDSEGCLILKKL